jgi:hypothetical protein
MDCACVRSDRVRTRYRRPSKFRVIAIAERPLAYAFPQLSEIGNAEKDFQRCQRHDRHDQRYDHRPKDFPEPFTFREMVHRFTSARNLSDRLEISNALSGLSKSCGRRILMLRHQILRSGSRR